MQAINSNAIVRILIMVVGVLGTLVILNLVLTSRTTGGVSALIFAMGGVGCAVALINPRAGLYLTAFEGIYLDFFKKLAVYYGEASMLTIIQVLVVTLLTLGCVYLGILLRGAFKLLEIRRADIILFCCCGLLMIVFAVIEPSGALGRIQGAANGGFYFGLVPSIAILFRDMPSLKRYLAFVFWCFVPFGGWAIYQYIFGFTQMEWFYGYTGLSPISSAAMLADDHPRVFGLASGPTGFGAVVFFPLIGMYLACNQPNRRLLYLLGSAILLVSTYCVEERTTFLFTFICYIFFLFYLTPRGTFIAYAGFITIFLCGVASSDYLIAHLEDTTSYMQTTSGGDQENGWKNHVLRVNTFSDRLVGWRRLKDPKSYSLFGRLEGVSVYANSGLADTRLEGDEYAHDVINLILIQTGVVGVLIFLSAGVFFLWFVHRLHLQIYDPEVRRLPYILFAVAWLVEMFVFIILLVVFLWFVSVNSIPSEAVLIGFALPLVCGAIPLLFFRIEDRKNKVLATVLAAVIMPNIMLQMIAGLTLTSDPINLAIWTLCGIMLSINRIGKGEAWAERQLAANSPAELPVLPATQAHPQLT